MLYLCAVINFFLFYMPQLLLYKDFRREKLKLKSVLIVFVLCAAGSSLIHIINMQDTVLGLLFHNTLLALILWLAGGSRGLKLIWSTLLIFISSMVVDLGTTQLITLIMPLEEFMAHRVAVDMTYVLLSFGCSLPFWGLLFALMHLYRWGKEYFKTKPYVLHVIRLVVLILIALGYAMLNSYLIRTVSESYSEKLLYINYAFLIIVSLLIVFMIIQELLYFRQYRFNQTLSQKQAALDDLLASMRMFRHNIGNMICGMDGAAMQQDPKVIADYYRQMVEKCTLVNPENIAVLHNLPVGPLHMLILHKLSRATEAGVPMYLYIEPQLDLRMIPTSDLCEIIGVLTDNAIEAAETSDAPYVSLELRSLKPGLELVIRNTFAGRIADATVKSVQSSVKHEGLGLSSLQKILDKHKNCKLNLRIAGRYVEAQVLAV